MKFCVIGAGNGGCAFAAYLSSKGYSTNLYNRTLSNISEIRRRGMIKSTGILCGSFQLNFATINLRKAVSNADVILITTPASAHKEIARKISPYLYPDQLIILNPGRCFGALEFLNVIQSKRGNIRIYVAETQTLLFTCRKIDEHTVKILKIKDSIDFSAFPETNTMIIYRILKDIFPQFNPVEDYLDVTLNNIGMLMHPALTLFNAGSIELGRDFLFYNEGGSKRICNVLENMQMEINKILDQINVKKLDFCSWAKKVYGVKSGNIYDALSCIQEYKTVNAPKELITRYLTEDVPTGLVPISSLGKVIGVETPTIDSIITLSSILCGIDFEKIGRNISDLNCFGYIKNLLEKSYINIDIDALNDLEDSLLKSEN